MPLIIPGVTTESGGDKVSEWQNKLLGKKLSDSTSDQISFAKTDLPKDHRVIEPGSIVTQDYNPDRLNVHLSEDGTIHHVDFK